MPSVDGPGPPTLLDAVRETIEIGERSGARVVASHIKAKGANYWGSSGAAISLIERARKRGVDVWADQLEGLPNRAGGARMRGFSMHENDMEAFARQPWVATSTDAGISLPDGPPSTNARFYGSFPRKIRHYAIDRGAISIESAIRSSTSLPATIMGLKIAGSFAKAWPRTW